MPDLYAFHVEARSHAREAADRLRRELEEIEVVEKYHAKEADRLRATAVIGTVRISPADPPISSIPAGTRRHEAAAMVLRALGGRAKASQIVRALRDAGYEKPNNKNSVFHNGICVAMSRHPDTFTKAGRGVWTLTPNGAQKGGEDGE